MRISYDVSDWVDTYNASKDRPRNIDDAIDLMRESAIKSGELAALLIVGRELGEVTDASLPSNKMSNLTGMALHIARYRSRQRVTVKLGKNQHETTVPRYVATTTTDEDGEMKTYDSTVAALEPETTVVDYNTPVAAKRARTYLMTNVVGRIRDRLAVIAVTDPGGVQRVADELKAAIDEIVKEIS
ncbi:MAG TPA: hypothetical protein VLA24_09315 [Pseudomonadales bacterium]|nr:hypothetical protein [Pseudomonadales bacterium]